MHPQLATIARELTDATAWARTLVLAVPEGAFQGRPDPKRWSVCECLVHLNLTTAACLPLIDAALDRAERGGPDLARRYRRDFPGWLLSAEQVRGRLAGLPSEP